MSISFYLPERHYPCSTWQKIWQEGLPFIGHSSRAIAIQCWIYQTWYLLSQAGVDCQLTTKLPTHGIVFVWNAILEPSLKEGISPDLFLVDLAMQQNLYPTAHLHIVQNKNLAQQLPNTLFAPHWPQHHLQPRDPKRGGRFENIGFFGLLTNCAYELQSEEWFQLLRHEVGAYFDLRKYGQWDDYSDIDAVVAIRDFAGSEYLHKPATKLYNAWLAGVPFIGGADSAYAAAGRPDIDYLVAKSVPEVLAHLKRLKEDLPFRNKLVHHGSQSSEHITREATLRYWKKLVQEIIPALANRLLSKLASADEVPGASGAQRRSVLKVLDGASTRATTQFAAEVEFGSKSNK